MGITKKPCPHCKEEIEIETKEPKRIEIPMDSNSNQMQILQEQINELKKPPPPDEPKEKKLSHEEMAELIPRGINEVKCKGSDCGHTKLKNPKQTKKYKSCPHCTANTLPKDSDSCPYCTKKIDENEELEDGIELEDDEE